MVSQGLVFSIFLIFTGAAVLSTLALLTRQSLLVAYILLGILLGPWGLKWVDDSFVIQEISDVGIVFLLFLLGLHLHPQSLWDTLRKISWVGLASSLSFGLVGYLLSRAFHFSPTECWIIGASMMFSSTIIGLKLLPQSMIEHQPIGDMMVGVLLLQDLLAIIVLLTLNASSMQDFGLADVGMIILSLPTLILVAFIFERYLLMPLFTRFDRIREYLFLLAIAWCLSLAELANLFGLSREIGAFIAGVAIASNSISVYLAECLKPIRDFFLVLFFFSVGASFNLNYLPAIYIPALVFAVVMLAFKPVAFSSLMRFVGEEKKLGWELGIRLGQISEFSLLIAYIASTHSLISNQASYLIQASTIFTFIVSSYWVVLRYKTPMSITDISE